MHTKYASAFAPCLLQAAIATPKSILAASLGNEAVVVQGACLPSVSGPLPSNMLYMGVPPTAKQWTLPRSLKGHATLQLGCGMVVCLNLVYLLMAVAVSLLPIAAIVAAIYTLPVNTAQRLAASVGSCNTPIYSDTYQITSFELGQAVMDTAAWCDAQTDNCSVSSFLSEMNNRVYETNDPARLIGEPCRAVDGCAYFDDDTNSLPRCIANVSGTQWYLELLMLLRNASTAGVETLPPSMIDGLVECTKQAIVTALDWVPTSNLVPPLTCSRLAAEDLLTTYSWREPLETLQSCVRLMLAQVAFYVAFLLTVILSKKLLVGRFRSGAWDFWDVRSMEWTRQFFGNQLSYINAFEWTLSKALAGSQWRMVLYRFSGMRVGKRVFVDRDVELTGARSYPCARVATLLPSSRALLRALSTDEDLIVLGDGACVGASAYVLGHEFTRDGKFKRGPVIVGAGSTVGPAARLSPFVTTEADSNIPALECALSGQTFRACDALTGQAFRRTQAKGDQTPMPPSGMPPKPPTSPPASPPGPPALPREQDEVDDGATPGRHQRPRATGGAGARTVLGAGVFATPTVAAAGTTRAVLAAAPWQALVLALGCAALVVAALALHARRGPAPWKRHDQRRARRTESTTESASAAGPVEIATSSGEKVWAHTYHAQRMHVRMHVYADITYTHNPY